MSSTFLWLICIPCFPTWKPTYSTSGTWNKHLSMLIHRLFSVIFWRTQGTSSMCFSSVLEYINISSIYMTTPQSIFYTRILLRCRWKTDGALVNLNGITVYSYRPHRVLNAVFHSSPSAIRSRLKPSFKSNFENIWDVPTCSISVVMRGRGYLSLMVMALSPR